MNPPRAIGSAPSLIIILLALAGLSTLPASARQNNQSARVWMAPNQAHPRVGSFFSVFVRISSSRDVGSVPFTVLFDPEILEFVPSRSREGKFLLKDRSKVAFLAKSSKGPSGLTGVTVGLSRLRSDRGVSGRGILCKLTFRAKATGISRLDFARARVLGPTTLPLGSVFEGKKIIVRSSR